jgi:hypothetical protein
LPVSQGQLQPIGKSIDSVTAADECWRMRATTPLPAVRAQRARLLRCLLVAALAVAGAWFAPTTVVGAETTPPAARKDGAADSEGRAAQLPQDYRNDLMLVEGKNGKASGFIADIKGRRYLVSSAVDEYLLAVNQRPGEANEAARSLVASLRAVSQGDVAARRNFTYDFFRRRFEQEQAKRKEINATLDKVLENLRWAGCRAGLA